MKFDICVLTEYTKNIYTQNIQVSFPTSIHFQQGKETQSEFPDEISSISL